MPRSWSPFRSRIAVLFSLPAWIAVSQCAQVDRPIDGSVLEPGASMPAELTRLEARITNGAPAIEGSFSKNGRTVRFLTRRGPRISLHEVLAGANEFETDACFVNEKGFALVVVAGGHENTMPECLGVSEGGIEGEGADDFEGQAVAAAAMEALQRLPFRAQYRGEQRALTGTLEFLRRPPAVGSAGEANEG